MQLLGCKYIHVGVLIVFELSEILQSDKYSLASIAHTTILQIHSKTHTHTHIQSYKHLSTNLLITKL